jgi:hypothetical protein
MARAAIGQASAPSISAVKASQSATALRDETVSEIMVFSAPQRFRVIISGMEQKKNVAEK